jgi:hypothetical protein
VRETITWKCRGCSAHGTFDIPPAIVGKSARVRFFEVLVAAHAAQSPECKFPGVELKKGTRQ